MRNLLFACLLVACGSPSGGGATDAFGDSPTGKRIVILMIGDGMGREHLTAASDFAHGEPGKLFMQTLPVHGTVVTSNLSGTTDSAAAATTLSTGALTWNGTIGLDRDDAPVETTVELAHRLGMRAGVVATSVIPHATPAGFSAHRTSRQELAAIADDQVLNVRPDVMLGGGAMYFLPAGTGSSVRTDNGLLDDLAAEQYTVVTTADELAAAPATLPLAGIFANEHLEYTVHRTTMTTEPDLTEMSLAALSRLDADPDGFFLMIEGSRIDMAAHLNLLAENVGETIAFDNTIRAVSEWAAGRDDVTLIVTADHECGGMHVTSSNGPNVLPNVSWRWTQHTSAPVDVFASGPGASVLDGKTIDHRWIHQLIASRITGAPFEPPPTERIPDGRLDDLPHVATTQKVTPSGFGAGINQLDALRIAADSRGLAFGIDGVFERGKNAVVLLIDVDFGASTGPARLAGALSDTNGRVDSILSASSLDAPATSGFGIDLAIVSWGTEDPQIEQLVTDAGMRGLRLPYGRPNELGWHGVAMNFGDGTKTTSAISAMPERGWEVHVPWQSVYPNGVPTGATLAVAAVLVNDDGGYTSNQALPPFPAGTANPGRVRTALPGIVVFSVDPDGNGTVDPITSSTVMP